MTYVVDLLKQFADSYCPQTEFEHTMKSETALLPFSLIYSHPLQTVMTDMSQLPTLPVDSPLDTQYK